MRFNLKVNGKLHTLDADPEMPLLWALRDKLGLVGTKFGCGRGLCGACTVHLDGASMRSCQVPITSVGEKAVTTIERIADTPIGRALQGAWLELDVPQCGYCQAGQLMSAAGLLQGTPDPNIKEIERAMVGNLCRCGTYLRIRDAVQLAAVRVTDEHGVVSAPPEKA